MTISEASRRKDNFDEANSAPVILADGQTWWIPKPWVIVRPRFENGVATSSYRFLSYSPALDALVEAIRDTEGFDAVVCCVATLTAYLLRAQYELSDADLDTLLAFRVGDPASLEWTQVAMATATGRNGKKVGSAGCD